MHSKKSARKCTRVSNLCTSVQVVHKPENARHVQACALLALTSVQVVHKHLDMHDVHDVYFLSWLVNHLDTTYTCTFLAVMELMVRLARMESPLGNTVNDSHDHPQGQQLYTISQRWMSARFTPRISLNLDRI